MSNYLFASSALAVLLTLSTPLKAQSNSYLSSSSSLLSDCKSLIAIMDGGRSNGDTGHSTCVSYIAGFRDAFSAVPQQKICLPNEVTTGQIARVFAGWADRNPNLLHSHRSVGLVDALIEGFPCS